MIKQIQKALCEKYTEFYQKEEENYLLTIVVNQLGKTMCKEDAEYLIHTNTLMIDQKFKIDGWIVVVSNTQKELFRIVER